VESSISLHRVGVNYSPAGAVAKYCDEYICVSVCPRGYLRNHTRDLYQSFFACCLCLWLSPPGMLMIGHITYRWEGVFFPIDNALYSIAFGTHTKTAEWIMMSGFGLTNSVLCGGDDPQRGKANF